MEQKNNKRCTIWGYPEETIPELGKILKWIAVALMVVPVLAIAVGPTLHNKDLLDGGILFFLVFGIEFGLICVAGILDSEINTVRKQRGTIFVNYNNKLYIANIFDVGFLEKIGYMDNSLVLDNALTVGGIVGSLTPLSIFIFPITIVRALKNLMDRESKETSTRYILRECIENNKLEKYIVAGNLNGYLEPINIIDGLIDGDKCLKIHYKTFNGKKYTDKKVVVNKNISEYEELRKVVSTYADSFRMRCPACGKEMSYGVCEFCGNKIKRKIDIKHILYKIFISWEEK